MVSIRIFITNKITNYEQHNYCFTHIVFIRRNFIIVLSKFHFVCFHPPNNVMTLASAILIVLSPLLFLAASRCFVSWAFTDVSNPLFPVSRYDYCYCRAGKEESQGYRCCCCCGVCGCRDKKGKRCVKYCTKG